MHERGKAVEGGLIECQTCEKKIYVVKKILRTIFLKFFSLNLILIYILNYFYHFQPLSYYKKCAYLKEVIRRDSDQCGQYIGQIIGGDFAKFFGLLRIYELYCHNSKREETSKKLETSSLLNL